MPPGLSLDNCPAEIKKNPLPFDECSKEGKEYRKPEKRFTRLSFFTDTYFPIPWDQFRMGAGGIVRPWQGFGFGAQLEWNFSDQVNFLGRLQKSFNTHRFGMHRLTIAALPGFQHFYGQDRAPSGGGPSEKVSGNMIQFVLEAAFDFRLFRSVSLAPFISLRYTPSGSLSSTEDPSRSVELDSCARAIFGIRLSLDRFNVGEW